jgi:hypothetical protein
MGLWNERKEKTRKAMRTDSSTSFKIIILGTKYIFVSALVYLFAASSAFPQQPFDPTRGMVLHGTVVTIGSVGTIISDRFRSNNVKVDPRLKPQRLFRHARNYS